MTIKELRKHTKCHIFIERTDSDGAVRRTEWRGATRDYQIADIRIGYVDLVGHVMLVELEEGGSQ